MNKKLVKIILVVILLITIIGGTIGYKMWHKPHDKAEDIEGVIVTVSQIANEFSTDLEKAKADYLDKVIEVDGTVVEVHENQDGHLLVLLGGEDPTASVQCSMRDFGVEVKVGEFIKSKGFCSGLSLFDDVMLTDCVLVQ